MGQERFLRHRRHVSLFFSIRNEHTATFTSTTSPLTPKEKKWILNWKSNADDVDRVRYLQRINISLFIQYVYSGPKQPFQVPWCCFFSNQTDCSFQRRNIALWLCERRTTHESTISSTVQIENDKQIICGKWTTVHFFSLLIFRYLIAIWFRTCVEHDVWRAADHSSVALCFSS